MRQISGLTNSVITDTNFPNGIKISELAENTNELFYNFTTGKFGYGDDARDFDNNGDDSVIIDSLDLEEDGTLTIWIEEDIMNARIASYLYENEEANETINIYINKETGVLNHTWGNMEYRDDIHELIFSHQYVLDGYEFGMELSDYEEIVTFSNKGV